jgi:CzcA family heavy metal efflux pump
LLARIVGFSLRRPGIVIALALIALIEGGLALTNARFDVFPEFAAKQIDVQTEAKGFSPDQVELLVTRPLELALNGAAGLRDLRSTSVEGLSLINVIFDDSSDVNADRQLVAERIAAAAASLPREADAPAIVPLTSSTGDLMTVGLTSQRLDPMQLRTFADSVVQPRLLGVPGIAKASVYGGAVRQLQIQLDPERLVARNVSVDDVVSAAQRATRIAGGGFIDTVNQRLVVRTESQTLSAAALAGTVLEQTSVGNVTIGDVARVTDAAQPPISGAAVGEKPAVILNLWTQYGANTLEATRGVDAALADLQPALAREGVKLYPDLFRAAAFIETANRNVESALLLGGILVMAVLFLFLANFRSAAISCIAIPLSLFTAISLLQKFGMTLNTLTLGGLAIAIGEVVDDAVIDVENILRRLRLNRELAEPLPPLQVVFDASLEVRSAVVYATLAVAMVFVPVLLLSGLSGRLFGPLALAYILAILASLLVALTVTPALSLVLLRDAAERPERRFITRLKERYASLLARVERNSGTVMASVAFLTIAAALTLLLLGASFLPELHEGHYLVHMEAAPGTSIDESLAIGREVTSRLSRLPFVRIVAQRVGRAEADDVYGPESSEFEVDLKPLGSDAASRAPQAIRAALAHVPGATFELNTFLTERIEETITGETAAVVVRLYGDDLDALDRTASTVVRALQNVRGAADVQMTSVPGAPQVRIAPRGEALARWGIAPGEVVSAVHTAFGGETAGELYEGNRAVDVEVILAPQLRGDAGAVARLPMRTSRGAYVPLSALADVRIVSGRSAILHDDTRRVQTITCNVAGRDAASFVRDARAAIARNVDLPPRMTFDISGTAAEEAASRRELLLHSLLAAAGVALLLSVVLGHPRNLLLVAANLPFALAGGILAIVVTGGVMSAGAMIGFVTLFGITLRNSIMMLAHLQHLIDVEGAEWNERTAIRGASERLVPIVMTSLVTALGLLPLALGAGAPGREIEGPMAIVILGGLVTSTALNLLVLPSLALRFGRFARA